MSRAQRAVGRRKRRGAPWSEQDDDRLLGIAHLPPSVVARMMQRSWHACRRRLAYLRANGTRPPASRDEPTRGG